MLIFENRYYNDCYAVFQSDLRYQVVSAFLFKKFKYGKFSFLIKNIVLTFLVVVSNKIDSAFRKIIRKCTAIDTFRI